MKLSELSAHWQYEFKICFDYELESWKKSSIWWGKKKGNRESLLEMRKWCREFIRFMLDVKQDKDIEECLSEWVGEKYETREYFDKRNAPQLRFTERYNAAKYAAEQEKILLTTV